MSYKKTSAYLTGAIFLIGASSIALAGDNMPAAADQAAPIHSAVKADLPKPVAPKKQEEVVNLTPKKDVQEAPAEAAPQASETTMDHVTSAIAHARDAVKGVYVMVGAQASGMTFDGKTHYYGPAANLGLGYQVNQNLAVEWNAQYLAKQHKDDNYSNHFWLNTLSVKGAYPMDSTMGVYGKVGVAYLNKAIQFPGFEAKESQHDYAPVLALGVFYHQTPSVDWTLEFSSLMSRGQGKDLFLNQTMLGVSYYL